MATVLLRGKPYTLVLSEGDMRDIDAAKNQSAAIAALQAAHGLPAHAPTVADNGWEWLTGDAVFPRGWKNNGLWVITRKYPHGLRTARHTQIG